MENIIENIWHDFWTDLGEMIEDIKEMGYDVSDYCDEYIAIADEDDSEYIIYLGHANRTIWVDSIREM